MATAPDILMGSVGTADFAQSFITRTFEEREGSGLPPPSISHVFLKRLPDHLVNDLIAQEALDPQFLETLKGNLALIKKVLDRSKVPMQVLCWDCFPPPFHGWIFGPHLMRNSWARTHSGIFHVKTVVRHYTKFGNPLIWYESAEAFSSQH
jgi:hypothetical protein